MNRCGASRRRPPDRRPRRGRRRLRRAGGAAPAGAAGPATACWARSRTPRTCCRRRSCGPGATWAASRAARRCGPGCTGSPPTPAWARSTAARPPGPTPGPGPAHRRRRGPRAPHRRGLAPAVPRPAAGAGRRGGRPRDHRAGVPQPALQHLPPAQRAVLILRDVVGWPAKQAAEQLGLSVAAANSNLHRAGPLCATSCRRTGPTGGRRPRRVRTSGPWSAATWARWSGPTWRASPHCWRTSARPCPRGPSGSKAATGWSRPWPASWRRTGPATSGGSARWPSGPAASPRGRATPGCPAMPSTALRPGRAADRGRRRRRDRLLPRRAALRPLRPPAHAATGSLNTFPAGGRLNLRDLGNP